MFAYIRFWALTVPAVAGLLLGSAFLSATPAAAAVCPALSFGAPPVAITGCSMTFTINANGTVSTVFNLANGSPFTNSGFDISGNVLVGVTNTTGSTIFDLMVATAFVGDLPIFDIVPGETLADTSLGTTACTGATGDEGITSNGQCIHFTIVNNNTGDVVFGSGLTAGSTAFFALASPAASVCITNTSGACIAVPEPGSLYLMIGAFMGFAVVIRRKLLIPGWRRFLRLLRARRAASAVSRYAGLIDALKI